MEKPLSIDEIQRYKRRLLDELFRHAREVEAVERGLLEPSGGERLQRDDESIEEAELESAIDSLASEDRIGYELNEAIDRIEAGTYGRCEDCDGWIPRQRLELLPHARLCAPCARAATPKEQGPR